jgi:DNA-binding FadR family transcriptional regulator
VGAWPGGPETAFIEHRRILHAIRSRDLDAAVTAMREHLDGALKRYVRAHGGP